MERCPSNPVAMDRMVVCKINGKITPFFAKQEGTAHLNLCNLAKDKYGPNIEIVSSRLWIDKDHKMYSDNPSTPEQRRKEALIDLHIKEIKEAHQLFVAHGKRTSFSDNYSDYEIDNATTLSDLRKAQEKGTSVEYVQQTNPNVSSMMSFFLSNEDDGFI